MNAIERNASVVRKQYSLFNERRHEEALGDWDDEAIVEVVPLGVSIQGRETYRGLLELWSSAIPDGHADVRRVHAGPDFVVAEFHGSGTWCGTAGFAGTAVGVDLCDVWTLEAGRIQGLRIYFDLSTVLQRLGLPAATAAHPSLGHQ